MNKRKRAWLPRMLAAMLCMMVLAGCGMPTEESLGLVHNPSAQSGATAYLPQKGEQSEAADTGDSTAAVEQATTEKIVATDETADFAETATAAEADPEAEAIASETATTADEADPEAEAIALETATTDTEISGDTAATADDSIESADEASIDKSLTAAKSSKKFSKKKSKKSKNKQSSSASTAKSSTSSKNAGTGKSAASSKNAGTGTDKSSTSSKTESKTDSKTDAKSASVEEDGHYTSKTEVAEYLHIYGHLPDNFITKKQAQKRGWEKGDDLWDTCPGMSMGGSGYGNYEGTLPEKKGRQYYECDIDYKGGHRGAKRIVYSNDGLIFYTGDHYETFEQLY